MCLCSKEGGPGGGGNQFQGTACPQSQKMCYKSWHKNDKPENPFHTLAPTTLQVPKSVFFVPKISTFLKTYILKGVTHCCCYLVNCRAKVRLFSVVVVVHFSSRSWLKKIVNKNIHEYTMAHKSSVNLRI